MRESMEGNGQRRAGSEEGREKKVTERLRD